MKRFGLSILTLTLAALTLSGCDTNGGKTPLLHGAFEGSINPITYEQLSDKISGQENFMLFSTPRSNCTCWTSFKDSILAPYIKEKNIRVFTVPFLEYYDDANVARDTFGLAINSSSQSLGLYKEGRNVLSREYNSTHKIWQSADSFAKYIDELIIAPKIIDLKLNALNSLYAQNDSFTVFYYDDGPESTYFRQNIIKPYAIAHLDETLPIYGVYVETIGIKLNQLSNYSPTQWEAFKDEYGLSSVNNPSFGWENGFMPTIQYIEPDSSNHYGNVIKAQATYLNDVLTETESGSYQIVDSFYRQSRTDLLPFLDDYTSPKVLINQIIPASDVTIQDSSTIWTYDKAAVYQNPLINAFMAYSIPLSKYILE